jgi:hypothetical protein
MGKKTLILSQSQLDEICGGNAAYLDGFASDGGDNTTDYANKITADGAVDIGYPDPVTTDDVDKFLVNNAFPLSNTRSAMGIAPLREMKKSDWVKNNIKEESEHGNKRLLNRNFGAVNGDTGKSYGATKTALCRKNAAEKKLNSTDPVEKQKARKTLNTMYQNWKGLGLADSQYESAKAADKTLQQAKPEGEQIVSAPKTGVGTAHSKKTPDNGIIY